ncbi:MAG: PKD domain-containing protein [Caldilineaceae bacterium]
MLIQPATLHAQAIWLQSKAGDDTAYFLFAAPARIERYDLATASWLTPINLAETPTAFAVDGDGIYVAFDRRVSRFSLTGSGEIHLENTAETITDLFTINEFLYINHSAYPYGKLTSVNKLTGITIDSKSYLYGMLNGFAVAPSIGKAFARNSGISPSDIVQVLLNADGTLGTLSDSPYHGDYPSATEAFLFPDESRVVDSAGIVYSTSDLTYRNSLAGAVDDIAFAGAQPIVLRDDMLVAYSDALLETGSYRPAQAPQAIYVHGEQIIAFSTGSTRGVEATAIALTLLTPTVPGAAVDPVGLIYMPDAMLQGNGDILYLLSKTHHSLFRWSLPARAYLPTIALNEAPSHVAYSAATNRLYLAYPSGKLTQIWLDETLVETPFANSPQTPCGLATAGEYLFVCDPTGAWVSHFTYHPDGTLIDQVAWNYFSQEYQWNAANRKLYFFRDDTSPNDLIWEEIDSDGGIGNKQDSPYHDSTGFVHPIRVAPDGSIVVLGSGRIYDASSLSQIDALANNIADAAWYNGQLYTIRLINNQTQVQRWDATYGLAKVVELSPLSSHLYAVSEGLLVVGNYGGLLRYSLLNGELAVLYQSPTLFGLEATNSSPAAVGQSVLFQSALANGVGTITYQWDFGDSTSASGKMVGHVYAGSGIYTATVKAWNAVETITATTTVSITGIGGSDTPIAGLAIATDSPTQVGRTTHLTATIEGGTNVSYQWWLGDGTVATGAQVTHIYTGTGRYTATVTATNSQGSLSAVAPVEIHPDGTQCVGLGQVTIQPPTDKLLYAGNLLQFTVIINEPVAPTPPYFFHWTIDGQQLPDAVGAEGATLDYTFAESGTHSVAINASNPCGVSTTSIAVTVQPLPADQPDLTLSTKSVTLANVEAGDILTYTIHLRNRHDVAGQISLTDTLPAAIVYVLNSAQASDGAITAVGETIQWHGTVISGTPALLTYAVEVQPAPVGTLLTGVGVARDQFGNTTQVKASSLYNSGYRLTINQGALYTNQPRVSLHYSWDPADAIQFVKFSNDGGFGEQGDTTDWIAVNTASPTYGDWPLAGLDNSLLPRTVYALFRAADGSQHGPFQDDIILDTLQPKLLQVTLVRETADPTVNATVAGERAGEMRLQVTASDENSGIAAIEVSASANFAAKSSYPMRGSTLDVAVPAFTAERLYVRAVDRAGNYSASHQLAINGSVQIFLPVVSR